MTPAELLRLQQARVASGAGRSLASRREALEALLGALEKHERALLAALAADLGKSPVEAFTSEIQVIRGECLHALKHLKSWLKPQRRRVPALWWPARAEIRREACGSVLVLGPWNYPLQLLLSPLASILAAGNSAVLKPSEFAPRTAAAVAALVKDSFDPAQVATLEGGSDVAAELASLPFDHIFFTGGTETGRKVMAAAARNLTPVTLELGGKCPVLIFGGDASGSRKLASSMKVIARRIAWGKHLNAGQTCVAPDHVFVEAGLLDALVKSLGEAFAEFGTEEYGRIINRPHFERLKGLLESGRIASGGACDEAALEISPTVLTDVTADSPVMREEIFGPILPVIACSDLAEALVRVRQIPPPLAVYLFPGNDALIDEVARGTRSGSLCVNDTVIQSAAPALPFGGVGPSGIGRSHGKAGFDAVTRERVVLRRSLFPDLPFRYPPAKMTVEKLKKLPDFFFGG